MANQFSFVPAEDSSENAPKPEVFVAPPVSINDITLTNKELRELASYDPERAQRIMDLQDRFAARAVKDDDRERRTNFQIKVLQAHQDQMIQEHAAQQACENNMHRRSDNIIAISGQRTGTGEFFLACCRCSKNFLGIGDGPGQLPRHIANAIDTSNWGK